MWLTFKNIVNTITYLYVPEKIFSSNKLPWYNQNLKRIKRCKQRKWNKYRSSRCNRHLIEYKNCNKMYNSELISSKSNYEKRMFDNKNHEPKKFFNYVKQATNSRDVIPPLEVNNLLVHTDKEKCAALSDQYKKVFIRDNGNFPPVVDLIQPNSFTNINICVNDIIRSIKEMNGNGSPGIDKIHPKVIKNVYHYLLKPLLLIFKLSLQSNTVPSDWKHGIIVPIYKKNGKPNLCSSYRPICLTSCISKILERIIHRKLLEYLSTSNLISENQHAFLSKRSTISNMFECTYDWVNFLNDAKCLDIIYIDFEKAFDKVSIEKLIYKLSKYGMGGEILDWLKSFLTNRQQTVRVGNCYSDLQHVLSGIGQGTILGPLLFLLYIDMISNVLSDQSCTIELYADDSKLYGSSTTLIERMKIADNLTKIDNWCFDWQLSINSNKCEVLHLGTSNSKYPYILNGVQIPDKPFCRDLGIWVDNDMKFKKHYEIITRNAHYKCKQFKRAFSLDNVEFLVSMYKTYILPTLEYGSIIWSPSYICDVDLIENVQRKFTKFFPGMFNKTYNDRLHCLNLVTLEERRIYIDLIFMYKIIKGIVDIDFNQYFSFNPMNTRGHRFKLYLNRSQINCHKNHFCNRIITPWNELSDDIVNCNTVNLFKQRVMNVDVKRYCIGRANRA